MGNVKQVCKTSVQVCKKKQSVQKCSRKKGFVYWNSPIIAPFYYIIYNIIIPI